MDEDKFKSIVVFPVSAKLKSKYHSHVSYFFKINGIIKKYKENIINESIDDIYNDILALDKNSKEYRKKHVQNIERRINEVEHNVCPECGHKLIKRKGKYGYFIACSNYPSCKYISKR